MKIFCIGRNYAKHAKELNNAVPTQPLVFSKPRTALLQNNKPFYHPEFSKNIHYECEIVIKICKNGRHVQKEFARNYYKEFSVGIDFTARDIQQQLKEKGHPWEIAKGFDHSAPLAEFISFEETGYSPSNIPFHLTKNGETVQEGNTSDVIFDFDTLICHISKYFTLQLGDLIFTGTPAGVGPVAIGDQLEAFIGDRKMLQCEIR